MVRRIARRVDASRRYVDQPLQALLVVVSREEFDDSFLHESARARMVDTLAALVG